MLQEFDLAADLDVDTLDGQLGARPGGLDGCCSPSTAGRRGGWHAHGDRNERAKRICGRLLAAMQEHRAEPATTTMLGARSPVASKRT